MRMENNNSNIPPYASEMLFAEDLLNRIMYRHNGTPYKMWRAGPFRDFIYNAFNPEVEKAVDFIDMMLEWEMDETFSEMVEMHQVNHDGFIIYVVLHEESFFAEGFDADNFLFYCVRLVSLAAYFDQYNVPQAPEIALFYILRVLKYFDMFDGGWDTLNTVAKKYVKRSEDFFNLLTPEASDDEPLVDESDEDDDDLNGENGAGGYFLNRDDGLVDGEMPKEPVHSIDDQ